METEHQQLVTALKEVLMDSEYDGSPLLIRRIPFICKDIQGINLSLEKINTKLDSLESYPIVTKLVFGAAGLILLGAFLAIAAALVIVLTHAPLSVTL